jgi:hypothetical protein
MLGPAQNPDGSLKNAEDIQWSYSRSPSPTLSPHVGKLRTPTRKSTGPKKRSREQSEMAKAKPPTHPTRSITSAVTHKSVQRLNLTLHDKITILDFMEEEKQAGRQTSQNQIVQHFRNKFPSLTQSSISRIKTEAQELRRRAEDPAQLSYKGHALFNSRRSSRRCPFGLCNKRHEASN